MTMTMITRTEPLLYDVVTVNLSDHRVTVWYRDKDYDNANAIIKIAIARRGVDKQIYAMTKPGLYNDGDTYSGGGLDEAPNPEDPDYIISGGMMYPRGERGLN